MTPSAPGGATRDAPAEDADAATPPLPPGVRVHPHQVAGHRAEEGRTSALATADGFFLKPLPADARGACELQFYERVAAAAAAQSAGNAAWRELARFVPAFHGVAHPRGAAGGPHLRLADATASLALPCVADVKVGFSTGDARFGEAYAAKCALKDSATTSRTLGFRVAGMQHWRPAGDEAAACNGAASGVASGAHAPWVCARADRRWCKALDAAGAIAALASFCACGHEEAARARAVACAVLQGPGGALAQLEALAAWFEAQRELHFFGASVLLIFDAGPLAAAASSAAGAPHSWTQLDAPMLRVTVKLVDFSHVTDARGSLDDNTLAGLRALLATWAANVQQHAAP